MLVPQAASSDPAEMSTRELLAMLQGIPAKPAPMIHPRNWGPAVKSVRDYLVHAPVAWRLLGGLVNAYPKPFRKVKFRSLDGTRLSAWLGVQTPSEGRRSARPFLREGILIVPGMFSTKDNVIQRARALKMFTDWGYHVFAMDLRGFGESKRVYNTGGWREAEDVIAAVREFRARVPIGTLHIYSESLGASASLIAAARVARQGERLIDGRLLAVSPYADLRRQFKHLSKRPNWTNEFYMIQWFFLRLLRLGGNNYPDFVAYARDAAKSHGVSLLELYRSGSPKNFVEEINIPTLILHSNDDPVVPALDANQFARQLAGKDNPVMWRLDWGSHCLYEFRDPNWFWNVLRAYFDFACPLPKASA